MLVLALRLESGIDPVFLSFRIVKYVYVTHGRQFPGGILRGVSRGIGTIDDDLSLFIRQQGRSQLSQPIRRQIDCARKMRVLISNDRKRLNQLKLVPPVYLCLKLEARYCFEHRWLPDSGDKPVESTLFLLRSPPPARES